MRTSVKTVLDRYQVRKTPRQKQSFRTFLATHAHTYGYEIQEQAYSRNSQNLIVGDPKRAKLILTAHYDTPPNFFLPIVASVGGIVPWTISQFIPIIPLLVILAIPRLFIHGQLATLLVREILLLGIMVQLLVGVANKHNANDNTSGVALLLSLLEDLPAHVRDQVCFVFFDDEEKGLIGAGKFKKAYGSAVQHTPLLNFDCIAHGSHFVFSAKKAFRQSEACPKLLDAIGETLPEEKFSFGSALQHIYTSDQLHFKNSVGVAAAHKLPVVGPILNRIHTSRDTKFDENNIETLKSMVMGFIEKLL